MYILRVAMYNSITTLKTATRVRKAACSPVLSAARYSNKLGSLNGVVYEMFARGPRFAANIQQLARKKVGNINVVLDLLLMKKDRL